jgi:hypothetical protein
LVGCAALALFVFVETNAAAAAASFEALFVPGLSLGCWASTSDSRRTSAARTEA